MFIGFFCFSLLLHAGCYSTRFRTVSKSSDWLLSSIRRCEIGQRTNLSRKMAKTTLFDNLKEIFCFRARKWEKITVLNSSPSRTILGIISFFPSSFFLFYPIFALNKLELPVYSNEAFFGVSRIFGQLERRIFVKMARIKSDSTSILPTSTKSIDGSLRHC